LIDTNTQQRTDHLVKAFIMTSLRIALKQSLEESGLALSSEDTVEKHPRGGKLRNKTDHSSSGGGGEGPYHRKKRGRPRKPKHQGENREGDGADEDAESSSENEFSAEGDDESGTAMDHDAESGHNKHEQAHAQQEHFSSAASKIQSHWKKKKVSPNIPPASASTPKETSASKDYLDDTPMHHNTAVDPVEKGGRQKSGDKSGDMTSKSKTVQPPVENILQWSRSLPIKKSRRNVAKGMRVKVRFATKVKKEGKLLRKKKWFGGRVTAVSKEGSKIRIKYDDGTTEVTKFPDKDVVIDDTMNGLHECPVDVFMPPETYNVEDTTANLNGSEAKMNTPSPVPRETSKDTTVEQPIETQETEQLKMHDEVSKQGELSAALLLAVAQTATAEENMNASHEKPRRKRGRPPKFQTPIEVEHSETRESESDEEQEFQSTPHVDSGMPPTKTLEESENQTSGQDFDHAHKKPEAEPNSEKPAGKLTIRISNIKKDERLSLSPRGANRTDLHNNAFAVLQEAIESKEAQMEESEAEAILPSSPPRQRKRTHDVSQSSEPPHKRLHIHISASKTAGDDDRNESVEEGHPGMQSHSEHEKMESVVPTQSSPKLKKLKIKKLEQMESSIPVGIEMIDDTQKNAGSTHSERDSDNSQEVDTSTNKIATPRGKKGDVLAARSGRRAAQQANERLSTKQDSDTFEPFSKKKKRRDRRKIEESDRPTATVEGTEDDSQWVQCDSCGKWRIIPSAMVSSLPKQWYCSDNIWDPKRASCDALEQTAKQVAKAMAREKKRRRRHKLMMQQAEEEGGDQEHVNSSASAKEPVVERSHSPVRREESFEAPAKVNHSLPIEHAVSIPVDTGDELANKQEKLNLASVVKRGKGHGSSGSLEAFPNADDASVEPAKKGRGRPRRTGHVMRESDFHRDSSSQTNIDDADNLEWVQCEKCDKWRKLPPHISADELPDVWYCSMNTWNVASASCDAPEDKADGLQDIGVFGTSGGMGSGKLSYRNLIFGSTGRKPNRPVSERTRAAESLFAVPSEDLDAPPAVLYANSSVFVTRKAHIQDENNSFSVLERMNRSSLWKELRSLAQLMNNRDPAEFANNSTRLAHFSLDMLPDELQESVKDLVLQTLGTRALFGDEVLLEVQKCNWENVPQGWAAVRPYCSRNVIIMALCSLVKEGVVECMQEMGPGWSSDDWNPKYMRAKSLCYKSEDNAECPNSMPSRCTKFAKPWKRTHGVEDSL
jgi:hypothetical protein